MNDQTLYILTTGSAECAITSASATEIVCDLGGSVPGVVNTTVMVDGLGNSASSVEFTYKFTPGSASPDTGKFELSKYPVRRDRFPHGGI